MLQSQHIQALFQKLTHISQNTEPPKNTEEHQEESGLSLFLNTWGFWFLIRGGFGFG